MCQLEMSQQWKRFWMCAARSKIFILQKLSSQPSLANAAGRSQCVCGGLTLPPGQRARVASPLPALWCSLCKGGLRMVHTGLLPQT